MPQVWTLLPLSERNRETAEPCDVVPIALQVILEHPLRLVIQA